MARHILSALQVRGAKAKDKPYRLNDGDGLFLLVLPSGVGTWQFRYKHAGKAAIFTIGKASVVTLAQARTAAQICRDKVQLGVQLTHAKRMERIQQRAASDNTFNAVSAAWVLRETRAAQWSADYAVEVQQSLANHLGALDPIPISAIVAPITAPLLRKLERSAPAMVEKVERRLHAIMDYAVESALIAVNPLPRRRRAKRDRKHRPAVTDLPGVGVILRSARASDPCKGIQRAHLLLAFTALRPTEVAQARWDEFELDGADIQTDNPNVTRLDAHAGNWAVPRSRMKIRDPKRGPHVVPLPPALLAAVREWRKADGPGGTYVCPAPRDAGKPVTIEGVEKWMRDVLALGGKHSPHSWRATFKSIAADAGKDNDIVESQMDHIVGTTVASAYDRAKRLERRRLLMTWYEATLIAARDGATVLPMQVAASVG